MYVGTAWFVLILISAPLSEADSVAGIASRASLFVKGIAPQIDLAELLERKTVELQMDLWWIYNLQTFHQEQDLFVLQVLHSVHAVHASHTQFTWYSDVMLSPHDVPRPAKMRQAACCRMVCVKQAPRFLTTRSNTAVVSILRPQPYPRSSECQDCNFGSPPQTSTFPHSVNSTQPA